MAKKIEDRFEVITETGCWIWKMSVDRVGYGHEWVGGKLRQAHRVSYETHIGPIPHGMKVLHKCDVRACINPSHLFLGTQKENIQDCKKKGRIRPLQAKSEENGRFICEPR